MIAFLNYSLIKSLKNEVDYLRQQNRDLSNQVIVLAGKAVEYNQTTQFQNSDNPSVTHGINKIIQDIKNIPALTEEEKKQQEEAESEMLELMRAS